MGRKMNVFRAVMLLGSAALALGEGDVFEHGDVFDHDDAFEHGNVFEGNVFELGNAHRELSEAKFKRLPCNINLDNAPRVEWDPNVTALDLVEIGCGQVYVLTTQKEVIEFKKGLNIVGKLEIPPNTKCTFKTPFVLVQGELVIWEHAKIGPEPNIRFIMTDHSTVTEDSQTLIDVTDYIDIGNANACAMPGHCVIGKKVICVAGGKLTIEGFHPDCPAWVKVIDHKLQPVIDIGIPPDPQEYPTQATIPTNCQESILESTFESSKEITWYGALTYDGENECLAMSGRKNVLWAFKHNFGDLFPCLQENVPYLLKFTYKVSSDTTGKRQCNARGVNCMKMSMRYNNGEKNVHKIYFTERHDQAGVYGEWKTAQAVISFTKKEITWTEGKFNPQVLIWGPEAGAEIRMSHFSLKHMSTAAYPDPANGPICKDLIINGNANEIQLAYPFNYAENGHLSVEHEAEKTFFRLGAGKFCSDIIEGCPGHDLTYNFDASLRTSGVSFTATVALEKLDTGKWVTYQPIAEFTVDDEWRNQIIPFMFPAEPIPATLRLTISGGPFDLDDLSMATEPTMKYFSQLVLPSSVSNCWDAGARIALTPFTKNYLDTQEATISEVVNDGNALVTLDRIIKRPTCANDSEDFATEVLLLSRNIVIEPDEDEDMEVNSQHGCHVIILHTPGVSQIIEGVKVFQGGQQGQMGRYPFHFHMCEDVAGSKLRKNLVHESFQRCYVIHVTHNVLLEENVAYDCFGHCFFLEDFVETGNNFTKNLGALTRNMPRTSLLAGGNTDHEASTFWISNPNNTFIANRACGSQTRGYWLELASSARSLLKQKTTKYNTVVPKRVPLGEFKDNCAHSNLMAFRNYPVGYDPPYVVKYSNTICFRNEVGFAWHGVQNQLLDGGVFADNQSGIENQKGDLVTIRNVKVMGYTQLYQQQLADYGITGQRPCENGPIYGISQPQILRKDDKMLSGNTDYYGMKIENVEFTDFENLSDCTDAGSVNYHVREDARLRYFQHQTQFQQVNFSNAAPIDFCSVDQGDVAAAFRILDDSISSKLGIEQCVGVGYYIGNHSAMVDLLDVDNNCTALDTACAYYCCSQTLCMQSVIFGVEMHGTEDLTLEVENTDDGRKAYVQGKSGYPNAYAGFRDENGEIVIDDVSSSLWHYKMRMFKILAPAGKSYTVTFKDSLGNFVHLGTIERYYPMNPLCTPETLNVKLSTNPNLSCTNLIRNGSPTVKNFAHIYQNYPSGVINSEPSTLVEGVYDATCTLRTRSPSSGFVFFLDPGCLKQINSVYTVSGKIRLVHRHSKEPRMCDNGTEACPEAWIVMKQQIGYGFAQKNYPRVAKAKNPTADGWHDFCGKFSVNAYMAASISLTFRIFKANVNRDMTLHQLSVTPGDTGC